ncbi:MAG: hypothetical protein AMJ54_08385 [Deltaproteobacteria bacterium SG8_13]|nr:MAG: hypothetical protein AMJ54_08385 [Deltaproteobacteria bacterium SG8_13]
MASIERLMRSCVEIGKAVTATLNVDQILSIILNRMSELIPARNWTLYLVDPVDQTLAFEVVVGVDKTPLQNFRIQPGEGIAGQAAQTGRPVRIRRDVYGDKRFNERVDQITGFKTESVICLPLIARGEVIGVLELINPDDPTLFDDAFLPVFSLLSDFMAIAIVNARNYEKINQLVITDDVTGQYNTRFLHEYLDHLLEKGLEFSLVFLDLDDFKQVVDTHGHQLGSQVLKEVAAAISTRLDPGDRLVHYGGDEFVIVLPDKDKNQTISTVESLRIALGESVFLQSEKLSVRVGASFGIASYPLDASDKKALLQLADNALYRSKGCGKNTITAA